jgi:hypothetical protein
MMRKVSKNFSSQHSHSSELLYSAFNSFRSHRTSFFASNSAANFFQLCSTVNIRALYRKKSFAGLPESDQISNPCRADISAVAESWAKAGGNWTFPALQSIQ